MLGPSYLQVLDMVTLYFYYHYSFIFYLMKLYIILIEDLWYGPNFIFCWLIK